MKNDDEFKTLGLLPNNDVYVYVFFLPTLRPIHNVNFNKLEVWKEGK